MYTLAENFSRSYGDKQYEHTAMVNHRGIVVAFAMDDRRQIYYTVLDLSTENAEKGVRDVKYWADAVEPLRFADELEQVGYGLLNPVTLPLVKKNTLDEDYSGTLSLDDVDAFMSSTARLGALAPFQAYSDGQHIYIFRQSIATDSLAMLYKLASGGCSRSQTHGFDYLLNDSNEKCPIVNNTLLVDRYILSGTTLNRAREVRYRRSQNKTTPGSSTDSLGATNMEGKPFYEPTKSLDFVRHLCDGFFSVLLLPTQISDIERWQIFAYNKKTKLIDSFNIERGSDGYFNTKGSQLYTSPEPEHEKNVLEHAPGNCPFSGKKLVPILSKSGYAEWAIYLDGDSHISIQNAGYAISDDCTFEMWIQPKEIGSIQILCQNLYASGNGIILEADGSIALSNSSPNSSTRLTSSPTPTGIWTHLAIVYKSSDKTIKAYVNGICVKTLSDNVDRYVGARKSSAKAKDISIGEDYQGLVEEVRLWSSARSAQDIVESMHHRLIGDELTLVGYWRLDEGSGKQVNDQTNNGMHGMLRGNAKRVPSDAPIGDHPGVRRTSFSFKGRDLQAGLAARLYYEQETTSNDKNAKPIKQSARVMLTAATNGEEKPYIGAIDFSVSREGKLAQIPDVIDLPELSLDSSDSRDQNTRLDAIVETEAKISGLERDITELNDEIENIIGNIYDLERQIAKISTTEDEKSRLEQRISTYYEKERKATFFDQKGFRGNSFKLSANKSRDDLSHDGWNDRILSIKIDPELVAECYVHKKFNGHKWNFSGTAEGWSNSTISSIKVLKTQALEEGHRNTQNQLEAKQEELNLLINQRDRILPDTRKRKQEAIASRHQKQNELNTSKNELSRLYNEQINGKQPLPMRSIHTDAQGLTVSAGLLKFAYTDTAPFLFDSALGRLALYFRGSDNQFFSAYYDVNTARAEWIMQTTEGSLQLIAKTSDSEASKIKISNAAQSDSTHCKVEIYTTEGTLLEAWEAVPREIEAFANVLNGKAAEKQLIGTLSSELMDLSTTIQLAQELLYDVSSHSTLIIGDRKLPVTTQAAKGSKAISVKIEEDNVGFLPHEEVYLLPYDYASKASSSRIGDTLNKGSIRISVVVDTNVGGLIRNSAAAEPNTRGKRSQWIADAPGRALRFNGNQSLSRTETDSRTFAHEGALTIEAWVKPHEFEHEAGLLRCYDEASYGYSLALKQHSLLSALSFNGNTYITLPAAHEFGIVEHDFTVEAWVRINAEATVNEQPILGNYESSDDSHRTNRTLHLVIRNQKPHLGFYGNDLPSDTALEKGTWYHLAFRYTANTKEQAIFIDGELDKSRIASSDYLGVAETEKSNLFIGCWRSPDDRIQGDLDEIRIWNIARSETDIKADMSRQLGDHELGLTGYYHFDGKNLNDRSGNLKHGSLDNDLTLHDFTLTESPLLTYQCVATVGNQSIQTTTPSVVNRWHHFAAVYQQSYALHFGGDAYADAGNNSMLNITEDLTIEAFIKLDSLGQRHGIASKGIVNDGSKDSVPYDFYVDESGKLSLAFEDEDKNKHTIFTSSSTLERGKVCRVAVVRKSEKKKLEHKGDKKNIEYTDENGNQQTKTVEPVESIDFHDYSNITFYIDGAESGVCRCEQKKPRGNHSPLYLGRSYNQYQQVGQLQGTISEIRIWNTALRKDEVTQNITGKESGLVAWWRFEENEGNIAYDTKSENHARIQGGQWVKNPDPQGSLFILYRDGQQVATEPNGEPIVSIRSAGTQFRLGAAKEDILLRGGGSYPVFCYKGEMEEVRIWRTVRRHEEILDNLFTRIKGEQRDLIANYTFDEDTIEEVKDRGLRLNHLRAESGLEKPIYILSTAPISNDTAQVRSAIAGIKTRFHEQISDRPAVVEYADAQRLADGRLIGIHKRCYSYTKEGKWVLLTGYKVGNLVTEWVSQVQFSPQIIGYIEGAPPVPSENMTEGCCSTATSLNGTSEIMLEESESVHYTVSTSKESGFISGFEAEAKIGAKFEPRTIAAPLGIGLSIKLPSFEISSDNKLSMEANGSWSGGESFGSGQNVSRKMSARLGGSWDVLDSTQWANDSLTRRFIPANTGFAFVESETADIYALRLEHNSALVAFRILPNPDIPKDTNIISFPINPFYSKQGTLDGRIGYAKDGTVVTEKEYAHAKGYGEYSYYKPKEAYTLKKRIERETQQLKEFYRNFNEVPPGSRMMAKLAGGAATAAVLLGAGGAKASGLSGTATAAAPVLAGAMVAGGMSGTIGSLVDATTNSNNHLPEKYARRNLCNTYVWTADGGFYEEATQISQVQTESKSGSYAFTGKMKGGFSIKLSAGAESEYGLNGTMGGSLNLTKSKSEEASQSFSLKLNLSVPDNLQRYKYNQENDVSSGVTPVYDLQNNPEKHAGKVDAYRFMTFYLEPQLENFEDFFGKVADPIWLAESQHPNAIALRQANQSNKKPKCWRVFHRVTFCSRILPDFQSSAQPSLEKSMKDINIVSNYELIRRLDPFVRNNTGNFIELAEAVKLTVTTHLPQLASEQDLAKITLFMADYYGVQQ